MRSDRAVVEGLFGDDHVVDMAFTQPLRGKVMIARFEASSRLIGVAHPGAQTAHQLIAGLTGCLDTVRAPRCPRGRVFRQPSLPGRSGLCCLFAWPQRAHAAVDLVATTLVKNQVARRLIGAGEKRADHHGVGARGDGFAGVARYFTPPSDMTGMDCGSATLTLPKWP